MTAQPWEPRLARLEGAYEQLDRRFGDLVARVDAGFTHVDKRFEAVDGRFETLERKVDNHFQWTVGLIVISILMPLLTHFLRR